MIIFSNKKSEELARAVACSMGIPFGDIEKKVFPDGEVYVRLLSRVLKKKVILIHTTQTNEDLIELILTLSAIKENHAKSITCIIPHMLYQRQDEVFQTGEAVSAEVFLSIIRRFADKIVTVNAHFLDRGGHGEFGGIAVRNLDAFPLLGKHFSGVSDLMIVAPDEGAMHYAEAAAKAVGCPHDHLVKTRLDGETVKMEPRKLKANGKNVVILDDIISTGGTMVTAADLLKKQGAKKVFIGCVHGLFTKGTDMFKGYEVVCTNSLPTKFSKVSLAPIIIEDLKKHL